MLHATQAEGLRYIPVATGKQAMEGCVQQILQAHSHADLSDIRIIVPNLLLAPVLIQTFARLSEQHLLLPSINTLDGFVAPFLQDISYLSTRQRQIELYSLLKRQAWIRENTIWNVCAELIALFDDLSEHSLSLPLDEQELLTKLERAYSLRANDTLAFEARLTHNLWHAEAQGLPSYILVRELALETWRKTFEVQANNQIYVFADSDLRLRPTCFTARALNALATAVPVAAFVPQRNLASENCALTLNAALPDPYSNAGELPLKHRAEACVGEPVGSLATRLNLIPCENLECHAQTISTQVQMWLHQGVNDIALIAMDRAAARRARALLERQQILIQDETGWKFSTTRVVASVHAWLELMMNDAWYEDVLDFIKSPFVLVSTPVEWRERAILELERMLINKNIARGWHDIAQALDSAEDARLLFTRLEQARAKMGFKHIGDEIEIVAHLRGLYAALESLDMVAAFATDAAGRQWLDWLQSAIEECASLSHKMNLSVWHTWFEREMDIHLFRDTTIRSSIVMTHFAAIRWRNFDAAIVIGGDASHFTPPQRAGSLSHIGVCRELEIPVLDERTQLREDFAALVLATDHCVVTWQTQQAGETLLPAPDMAVLSAFHQLRFDDDLIRSATPIEEFDVDLDPTFCPAPKLLPQQALQLLPQKISASLYRSVLACPYQFFSRYVLRLDEQEEILLALEKRDFGEMVHKILQHFHERYPRVTKHTESELLAALEQISMNVFAPAIEQNYLEHAWLARWRKRMVPYLQWQREREQNGWFYLDSEVSLEAVLPMPDKIPLQLHGRLDRVDRHTEGEEVLDYKLKSTSALREMFADPEDIQLSFYTLLRGPRVASSAYVALDDDRVSSIVKADAQHSAEQERNRLQTIFMQLRNAGPIPANGRTSVCQYCEMQGVCRKEDWS